MVVTLSKTRPSKYSPNTNYYSALVLEGLLRLGEVELWDAVLLLLSALYQEGQDTAKQRPALYFALFHVAQAHHSLGVHGIDAWEPTIMPGRPSTDGDNYLHESVSPEML
eukprot:2214525-Amphidinium_carterae.1